MSTKFWIASFVWVGLVFVSVPFLIELFDRRGIGLMIPGLSATASEIVVGLVVGVAPPALVAWRALRAVARSR